MTWSEGKCPACGAEIYVPTDKERFSCPKCNKETYTQAALAFKSENPKSTNSSPSHSTEKSETSFLDNWKTSVGMFILGLVCSYGFGSLGVFGTPILLGVAIVFVIGILYWTLAGYPSLFTDRPHVKSRGAASFLNAFFGGIVFGALWNTCLTKRRKGVSQNVFLALVVVMCISAGALFVFEKTGSDIPWIKGNEPVSTRVAALFDSDYIYEHPEEYCSTDNTMSVINAGRTGDWSKASKSMSRITFGHVDYDSYGAFSKWTVAGSGNDAGLSAAEHLELTRIALMQMYGTSVDNAQIDAKLDEVVTRYSAKITMPDSSIHLIEYNSGSKTSMVIF